MSESNWTKLGATLSHKNAGKEFGLTENEIIEGIKQGKLQYRINCAHGNPYYKLLRAEVHSFAQELRGTQYLEEQELNYNLQKINKEINSLKRKLVSLEKQKIELIEIQKRANPYPI